MILDLEYGEWGIFFQSFQFLNWGVNGLPTDENDNEDDNEGENAIVLSQVIEKSKIGGAVFNFSKCTVNINVTK